MNNLFSITFGKQPLNYIVREKECKRIIDDFSNASPFSNVYIITGIRGSEKTVMLSYIYNYFNNLDNWIVVDLGPKDNLLENIVSELYEVGKMKHIFIKAEFSFSFHGLSFSIEGNEPVSSVNTLLKKILDQVKKKGKSAITIEKKTDFVQTVANQQKKVLQDVCIV